jgi:hypothetical protein
MKKIEVEIQGIADLLQANVLSAEEGLSGSHKRRKTSGAKNEPEEWKKFLYPVEGGLGHPSAAIESALATAAREFKADKRRTMKDVVKACVFVEGDFITLSGKTEPDMIRRDIVVNPNTKGRGFVYRPLFNKGWKATFTLVLADEDAVPSDQLKEMLDFAGARIGIGAWRPKFGRFMVTKFEGA